MPVFFLSTELRTNWNVGGGAVFIAAGALLVASVAGKLIGIQLAGKILGWARGEAVPDGLYRFAGGVSQPGHCRNIDDGAKTMGGNGAGYQAGFRSEKRRKILQMKAVILTHLPPDNSGAFAFQL